MGAGGVVQYSHTFKILYGKDAISAVSEIVAQQDGKRSAVIQNMQLWPESWCIFR